LWVFNKIKEQKKRESKCNDAFHQRKKTTVIEEGGKMNKIIGRGGVPKTKPWD